MGKGSLEEGETKVEKRLMQKVGMKTRKKKKN
jgi:hypothetical protein